MKAPLYALNDDELGDLELEECCLCMYVCMHVCMHVRMCVYVCIYIYMYMYIYIYIHINYYIHPIHVYVGLQTCSFPRRRACLPDQCPVELYFKMWDTIVPYRNTYTILFLQQGFPCNRLRLCVLPALQEKSRAAAIRKEIEELKAALAMMMILLLLLLLL